MGDIFVDLQAVKLLERIAVALEARSVAPTQNVADLVDNLHAEIATLKALNAGQHAASAAQRQELEMLRPLLVDGAPSVPEWPTPQPIETAPLGQLMAWPADADEEGGPTWSHAWPDGLWSVDEWRRELKALGRKVWLPMPPPPGGGK